MYRLILALLLMWVSGWNAGCALFLAKRDGMPVAVMPALLSAVILLVVLLVTTCEYRRLLEADHQLSRYQKFTVDFVIGDDVGRGDREHNDSIEKGK